MIRPENYRCWEYKLPIITYIFMGIIIFIGGLGCLALVLIYQWKEVYRDFFLMFFNIDLFILNVGTILAILSILWFIITTQWLTLLEIPINGQFMIILKKDGIYGKIFLEYLSWKKGKKLCDWDEIEKIVCKGKIGIYDSFFTRTIFYLKNKKKFIIPHVFNAPIDDYFYLANQYEKQFKHSNRGMYGIILRNIGEDKFINFPKKMMLEIKEGAKTVDDFFNQPEVPVKENKEFNEADLKDIQEKAKIDIEEQESKNALEKDLERFRKKFGE